MKHAINRRDFLKYGGIGLGTVVMGLGGTTLPIIGQPNAVAAKRGRNRNRRPGGNSGNSHQQSGNIRFTPFTQDLPLPQPKSTSPAFTPHLTSDELDLIQNKGRWVNSNFANPKYYQIDLRRGTAEMIPGVTDTEIWGYDGLYPGPTFRAKHNEPVVVRYSNHLPKRGDGKIPEPVTHLHGGHQAAYSDGSANVVPGRVIPFGESRDFLYPNIGPIDPATGEQDISDIASTLWYHDHEADMTGHNVYMGLAGYYLLFDHLEEQLIDDHVLPSDPYDIPLVLQDRKFDRDGQLVFDPDEDNYDGVLGDTFLVNGKAQPKFHVERRKYRFRILNGSNARVYELRLTSGQFLQIGTDSWLLPKPVVPSGNDEDGRRKNRVRVSMAERADVIIDFRNAPDEVFLENVLEQDDGRGPDEASNRGTPLLKFIVEGSAVPNDVTVQEGTSLRPHRPITDDEVRGAPTFHLEFERTHGRWAINDRFFDPNRDDVNVNLNSTARFFLENGGGGWSHPLHLHLEAHEVQRVDRRSLAPQERFKKDTILLGPNEEAEIRMRFRTFSGRYVSHCHNLEHEDQFMMLVMNVRG